jgi:hypothetical protein
MNTLRTGVRPGSDGVLNEPGNASFQRLLLPPKDFRPISGDHPRNLIYDWQSYINRLGLMKSPWVFFVAVSGFVLLLGCATTPGQDRVDTMIIPTPEELADTATRLYQLRDHDFFGAPSNEWAEILQAYHCYLLERCRLPSLARQAGEVGAHEYRLVATIGGHDPESPRIVRVFWTGSQAYISGYTFPDYRERFLGSPIRLTTRRLTPCEVQEILNGLVTIRFWEMERIDSDVPCHFHEGRRFLEGLSSGIYHCVDVGEIHYEESPDFLQLVQRLQELIL